MEWIIFSEKDIDDYKTFINGDAYSGIWHSVEWLDFQLKTLKAVNGFFFGVKDENEIVLAGLFLIQKSKKFKFGYIPAGFLYKKINAEILNFLFNNINNLAKKENLLFTQVDSITPFDGNLDILLKNEKRVKTGLKLPIPQFTNTIDLSLSYDDILAAMKPKGRYNIKLAEKKGVRIKKGSISEISEFYKLLKETTERDGFRPNNEEYYRKMVEIIPNSQLLVAYHEEDILASGIFTYFNNQGLYYYGASSNVKRNL
nr:peptidoglycan bridge formation glycyltransferase FemA/FemB family protein [Spirochaetota bacterium]